MGLCKGLRKHGIRDHGQQCAGCQGQSAALTSGEKWLKIL